MDNQTQIAKIILDEAKRQFYSKEISLEEYQDTLAILYDRLTEIEQDSTKKRYILKVFSNPFRGNILETLNFSLAMN